MSAGDLLLIYLLETNNVEIVGLKLLLLLMKLYGKLLVTEKNYFPFKKTSIVSTKQKPKEVVMEVGLQTLLITPEDTV
jgi:hypothetical protein